MSVSPRVSTSVDFEVTSRVPYSVLKIAGRLILKEAQARSGISNRQTQQQPCWLGISHTLFPRELGCYLRHFVERSAHGRLVAQRHAQPLDGVAVGPDHDQENGYATNWTSIDQCQRVLRI